MTIKVTQKNTKRPSHREFIEQTHSPSTRRTGTYEKVSFL